MKMLNSIKNLLSNRVNIFIILLAISPSFALGDGNRNLLLIGAMFISPLFILRYPKEIFGVDKPLLTVCIMMLMLPFLFHYETYRISTILFTCMFCLNTMSFARVLRHNAEYNIFDFYSLLKMLIYAYCIVLMIQQICVLTGLPIFNISNYNPQDPWKLNSLMSEPSHSARIVPLLMYLFILCQISMFDIRKLKDSYNQDTKVWFAFMWCILTMGSATGILFLLIIISKFVNVSKFGPSLVVVGVSIFILSCFSEVKSVHRLTNIVSATVTLNAEKIIDADHSASFRIVPTIQGFKAIDFDINLFVGHGVDADTRDIAPLPTVEKGCAGAFSLWYNYGMVVALLFWVFSFGVCYLKSDKVSILLWLLCVWLVGGLNNQILWLTITLLYTYKNINREKSLV